MFALRRTSLFRPYPSASTRIINTTTPSILSQHGRFYAKKREQDDDFHHMKAKKGKHKPDDIIVEKNNITDPSLKFVPSSSMPHGAEYDKEEKSADEKMNASLKWLKEQSRNVEVRSSGRVVPDVLDGVKVPMDDGSGGEFEASLKEVATIGVKNGNVLVVTVFDEHVSRTFSFPHWTLNLFSCSIF
jgi:ribosome recycling factor